MAVNARLVMALMPKEMMRLARLILLEYFPEPAHRGRHPYHYPQWSCWHCHAGSSCRRSRYAILAVGLSAALPLLAQEDQFQTVITPAFSQASRGRLVNAAQEPENWMMYSGTLASQRYSRLDQITKSNVSSLEMKWSYQIAVTDRAETVPAVVDGIMFIAEAPSNLAAVDAQTGRVYWRHDHELPDNLRRFWQAVCKHRFWQRGVYLRASRKLMLAELSISRAISQES